MIPGRGELRRAGFEPGFEGDYADRQFPQFASQGEDQDGQPTGKAEQYQSDKDQEEVHGRDDSWVAPGLGLRRSGDGALGSGRNGSVRSLLIEKCDA